MDTHHDLRRALDAALEVATSGKGEARHGLGLPFKDQPIMNIQRSQKGIGFPMGQIQKKAPELMHFDNIEAQKREILDIIVYAAGAWLYLEEQEAKKKEDIAND